MESRNIAVILTGISGWPSLEAALARLKDQYLAGIGEIEIRIRISEDLQDVLARTGSFVRSTPGHRIRWTLSTFPASARRYQLREGLAETAAARIVHLDESALIGRHFLVRILGQLDQPGVRVVGALPKYRYGGVPRGSRLHHFLRYQQRLQEVLAELRAVLPGTNALAFDRGDGLRLATVARPVASESLWLVLDVAARHGWEAVSVRPDLPILRRNFDSWEDCAKSRAGLNQRVHRLLSAAPHLRDVHQTLIERRETTSGTHPEQEACNRLIREDLHVSREEFDIFQHAMHAKAGPEAGPRRHGRRPTGILLDRSAPRLKIRGPYTGSSGYEHHTREFTRHLHQLGVDIQLEGVAGWGLGTSRAADLDPWYASLHRSVGARVCLHFDLPHKAPISYEHANAHHTMFEAASIQPAWRELQLAHDRILVPCESNRRAWIDSGIPASKVRLSPLGVDTDRFHPDIEPLPLVLQDGSLVADRRFRFLNISASVGRKNTRGLLRMWFRATRRDDDAVLVLKLNPPSEGSPLELDVWLQEAERLSGRTARDVAPILILIDYLPIGDLPRLHAVATHYVSVSCGEGWDNPMIEAAAMNRVLVAPRHSAYPTYLPEDVAHWIPSSLAPAIDPNPLFAGLSWWRPDEDVATALLRDILDGRAREVRAPRPGIVEGFTYRHAARKLLDILLDDFGG